MPRIKPGSCQRARRLAALAAACACAPASAQALAAMEDMDLTRLSIEELANLEVMSVSKRRERVADAAASVYVLGNDDVRRSGVQSLAEALRLAPNLDVQRVDALDYAISARGLNGFESSNKLLVLIDGRSVYSPFFSGVEWAQNHPPLADLDRIEVVSGPGGTLWGANAVNGVINVVTRPADETLGLLFDGAAGTGDDSATLRYGFSLGEGGAFRVYARGYERADTRLGGAEAGDGWRGGQVGFRSDFRLGGDRLTLQGDAYHDDVPSGVPANPRGELLGQNLLGRWTHGFGENATLEVQAYYDRYKRRARGILDEVSTYDVQAQQTVRRGRHALVAGIGYRRWRDRFANFVNPFTLDPPRDTTDLFNAFVQDQVEMGPVMLTLGVKAEANSFSGTDWLPNLRLAWRLSDRALVWGAVSRAVRDPSRLDRDLVFPGVLVRSNFQPERLTAFEVGYRGRPAANLSLAATLFYHDYRGLRSTAATPVTILPVFISNGLEGETWGVEAWGDWDVTEAWRLSAGFTALGKRIDVSPGAVDISSRASGGHDPAYGGFVRSQLRLSESLDLDVRMRVVDDAPREQTAGYLDAPAYAEADARLAWRMNEHVELSVAGLNLLHAAHPEATEPRRTEARRSFQAGLRLSW